ncbi:MAG: type II secretion system protein [Candidatus Berkelbacteria bacterium]
MKSRGTKKAFTLVELLIVIAIISIVTAFIMFNVKGAQSRARDSQRMTDLATLDSAIKTYYIENGHYPSLPSNPADGTGCGIKTTFSDGVVSWIGSGVNMASSNGATAWAKGSCLDSNFIPGLVPKYIGKLPTDPGPALISPPPDGNHRGYMYYHIVVGGRECYKIMVHSPENAKISVAKNLWDPSRDGGADHSSVDGNAPWAWSQYSRGCAAY